MLEQWVICQVLITGNGLNWWQSRVNLETFSVNFFRFTNALLKRQLFALTINAFSSPLDKLIAWAASLTAPFAPLSPNSIQNSACLLFWWNAILIDVVVSFFIFIAPVFPLFKDSFHFELIATVCSRALAPDRNCLWQIFALELELTLSVAPVILLFESLAFFVNNVAFKLVFQTCFFCNIGILAQVSRITTDDRIKKSFIWSYFL